MTTQKSIPVEALPVGTIVDFHVGSWMHGTEVEITDITCNGVDSYLFSFNRGPNVVCEGDLTSANIDHITKIHKRGKGPVYHVSQENWPETNFERTLLYRRKGYVSEHGVERFIWQELHHYGQNGTTFSQAITRVIRDAVHSRQIDLCNWYKTKTIKRWLAKNINRFRIGAATYSHYETLMGDYGYCFYGDGLDDELKDSIGFRDAIDDVEKHIDKILYASKRYNRKIHGVLNSYRAQEFKGQIYRHTYMLNGKRYVLMSDVPNSMAPDGYSIDGFEFETVSQNDAIAFFNSEQKDADTLLIKHGIVFVKFLVDPSLLVESTESDYDPLIGEYGYGELDFL